LLGGRWVGFELSYPTEGRRELRLANEWKKNKSNTAKKTQWGGGGLWVGFGGWVPNVRRVHRRLAENG